jgi:hypothetical protein
MLVILLVDIKVTTVMDLELKTAFELAFSANKSRYKEALDRGALAMLEEQDPLKASELRVSRYLQLIAEEERKQEELKYIQKVTKKEAKKEVQELSLIETNRRTYYEGARDSLVFQIHNNSIDWKHLSAPSRLNFKNAAETEAWTREQLFQDQLIGCENCRKWKSAEQYCSLRKQITSPARTCRDFKKK